MRTMSDPQIQPPADPANDGEMTLEEVLEFSGTLTELNRVRRMPNRKLQATLRAFDAGYPMDEIAAMFGYTSASSARIAIESALAASEMINDREVLRQQARNQLDRFFQAAYDHAVDDSDPDQRAWIATGTQLLDRKIKLLGLDAPTAVTVTPDLKEFERVSEMIALASGGKLPGEADPFEIEAVVVEDEPGVA